MAASYGSGSSSPPVIGRPIERVFEEAQNTGEVNLSGRKLKEYPKISLKYDLADTIVADLSKNRLVEVPPEICEYSSIERINCYHNCIKSIPDNITQLQLLTHLNLSRNQLTVLPACIGQLLSLEVLIAANNKLVSLPEEIGMLEKLHEIDVSCNEISHLPLQIGDLSCLRSLNVRRNLLVELPLEISRLNLRKVDFSSNRIEKIPTVFRKIDTLEEIILDHNPLISPTAHICTKGRKHIMKYLHIEAIKEDRKRGILHESEMKRLVRKSLPPQQTSDEFRNLVDSPDSKWKRHTVLSSDSGYSTTDSLEKCGWSPSEVTSDMDVANSLALRAAEAVREHRQGRDTDYHRRFHDTHKVMHNHHDVYEHPSPLSSHHVPHTLSPLQEPPLPIPSSQLSSIGNEDAFTRELQRQKSEYDRRKKMAEQIRIQQEEEEEREERRRAAVKLQEEQCLIIEKQREDQRLKEEGRLLEESRRREEENRTREEAQRVEEEIRRIEEVRRQEELQRKAEEIRRQQEAKQREETRLREDQKPTDVKKQRIESSSNLYGDQHSNVGLPLHDGYNNATYFYPDNYYHDCNSQSNWDYRKQIQSSNSFKEEKKITNNIQYRRTASDSVRKPTSNHVNNSHVDNNNYINRNGVGSQDSINSNSSSSHSLTPATNSKNSTPSPASSNPSIARLHSAEKKSTPAGSPVVRRAKIGDKTNPTPARTTGRTTPSATTPRSQISTPTTKRNNLTSEEEFKKKHQALQNKHILESQTLRKRLEDTRIPSKEGTPQKRPGVGTPTNSHNNSTTTSRNRTGLSAGTMKLLEEYKDSNPNFTIRRHHEQQCDEIEHLDQLRQIIESRLKVTLPDNLPDALRDGVVLCHLANQIRPRSVASIHVPSPAVPKLTMAKCRRNVENFLEACRKIGVNQEQICSVHDILEEKSVIRIAITAGALVAIGTNPKQSAV